jgi:Zn ribbon nucleic-acid-binding protein
MSTAARLLREAGASASAEELERDAKIAAPWCPQCERAVPDPVVAILGDRVAFACPHCSSPEVLAKWKAEAP